MFKRVLDLTIAAAMGAAFFLYVFPASILNPTNAAWLYGSDYGAAYVGWAFYRADAWRWPLGATANLLSPIGTAIGLTDSIPLLAMPFKLAAPLLQPTFQYFGVWLLACYVLQGVLGWRLSLIAFRGRRLHSLLGAAFFVVSPILVARAGHLALCGHWLVLLAILIALTERHHPQPRLWTGVVLAGLASMVHPYLMSMVLPIWLTTNGLRARMSVPKLALRSAACIATALVGLMTAGYFRTSEPGAGGFGAFSTSPLSLFDSLGFSRFLPALPSRPGQYEGFGYLGAGALLVLIVSIIGAFRLWRQKSLTLPSRAHWGPLVAVAFGLFVFAMATPAKIGPVTLFSLSWFYNALGVLPKIFRSSGRFVWPLHYVSLFGALALADRVFPPRVATVLLLVGLSLQWADLEGYYGDRDHRILIRPIQTLASPTWEELGRHYRHLEMVPPMLPSTDHCFEPQSDGNTLIPFALLAARTGMDFNSGYTGRQPVLASIPYCTALRASIDTGQLSLVSAYVVSDGFLPEFQAGTKDRAVCQRLDGLNLCVASASPMAAALAKPGT